jgi:hypothetical protein
MRYFSCSNRKLVTELTKQQINQTVRNKYAYTFATLGSKQNYCENKNSELCWDVLPSLCEVQEVKYKEMLHFPHFRTDLYAIWCYSPH